MSIGYTFPPGPDVGDAGAGMALVMRAKAVPFEVREHAALAELSHAAADFTAKLRSGEIEPIITPIEEDPNAATDPTAFLGQLQSNPYLSEVFLTLQNLGERLDEVAAALCTELFASGGSTETWAKVENYLLAEGKHPKQGVFEGRDILSPTAKEWLRRELQEVEADDYNSNDPRHLTEAEVEKALSAREYSFCHEAAFLAQAVVMRGVAAPDMELADLASSLQRKATAARPEVRSYDEDRPPGASSRSRTWRCRCGRWRRPEGPGLAVRHPGDQRPGQCPPTTLSAFRPCSGPWKSSRSSPRWRKPGTMPSPQESSSGYAPV